MTCILQIASLASLIIDTLPQLLRYETFYVIGINGIQIQENVQQD